MTALCVARRGSTIGDVTREAIEAPIGGVAGKRLIAEKRDEAEVATRRGAARRIEAIIRQAARRSR